MNINPAELPPAPESLRVMHVAALLNGVVETTVEGTTAYSTVTPTGVRVDIDPRTDGSDEINANVTLDSQLSEITIRVQAPRSASVDLVWMASTAAAVHWAYDCERIDAFTPTFS